MCTSFPPTALVRMTAEDTGGGMQLTVCNLPSQDTRMESGMRRRPDQTPGFMQHQASVTDTSNKPRRLRPGSPTPWAATRRWRSARALWAAATQPTGRRAAWRTEQRGAGGRGAKRWSAPANGRESFVIHINQLILRLGYMAPDNAAAQWMDRWTQEWMDDSLPLFSATGHCWRRSVRRQCTRSWFLALKDLRGGETNEFMSTLKVCSTIS